MLRKISIFLIAAMLGALLSLSCSDDVNYDKLDWTSYDDSDGSSDSDDSDDDDDSSDDSSDDSGSTTAVGTSSFPRSIVYTAGEDIYNTIRIPVIVKSPVTGTLFAFAEGRTDSSSDFGDIDIIVKTSTDLGATWSDITVVAEDGTNRCCNPVAVALESGRILLMYIWSVGTDDDDADIHKVYYTYTDDDGETWASKTDITDQVQLSTEYRYMTGPVHGIVKQYEPNAGRIIIPTRCPSTVSRSTGNCHVIYSDDGGVTWEKGGFSDFTTGNENTVCELADGSILMNMRNTNSSNYYRYDCTSTDGGESFGHYRMTSLIEPASGCLGSLLTYGIDSSTGEAIVLFSNPNHTSSRRYGSIKVSVNSGDNWTLNYQYVPSSGNWMYSAYSDLVMVDDTTIGVLTENGSSYNRIVFTTVAYEDIVDEYEYQ